MNAAATNLNEIVESDIAEVLQYRYGDGLVYLPKSQPDTIYRVAVNQGFVDQEGYVTRKGRSLLAKYHLI